MAIKTVLIDDFDDTPLTAGAATTTFSINGTQYEIDLGPDNVAKLRDALAPFISAGRRVGTGASPKPGARRRGAGRHSNGSNDVTAIREWARANGHEIGDRGRIPAAIIAAYEAAN